YPIRIPRSGRSRLARISAHESSSSRNTSHPRATRLAGDKAQTAIRQNSITKMTYEVVFTEQARADLHRLYGYLLDHAQTVEDLGLGERALTAIESAVDLHLSRTPFIYRKAFGGN